MFENIIGQTRTLAALSTELSAGTFPRAALFYGPAYSGKLSTALEVARILTCRTGKGDWACECSSCRMQRELAHPYTVLMGYRYSEIEIAASADALLRGPRTSTRYLFLRAVRKLLRRFDPVIWDAEETRMRGVQERISRIEELLEKISPGSTLADPGSKADGLDVSLQRIIEECTELAAQSRNDHIAIGQVRKLSAWAHLTATDSLKVALVENADRMQESARNALLKLLEEPPDGVRLILLSTRRSAIIPTVLSRLRPYSFFTRNQREEQDVLAKIFHDETGRFSGLRSFFLAWKEISSEELARICRGFLGRVMSVDAPSADILKELGGLLTGSTLKDKEAVLSLLEEITLFMQCALRQSRIGLEILEEWNRSVREAQAKVELYNVNPQAAVECLFLQMRAAFSTAPAGSAVQAGSGGGA
jgi:DNA polymerase III delta prime subunit